MRLPGAGPGVIRRTLVEHEHEQGRRRSRSWATQKIGGKWHAVKTRSYDAAKCFDTKTYGCGWIRAMQVKRHRNAPPIEDRCQKCERMYAKEHLT